MANLVLKDLLFYVQEPPQDAGGLRESSVPTMATITEVIPLQAGQDHVRSPVQVCVQDTAQANMIILCLLSTINSFQSHGSSPMFTHGLGSLDVSWTLSCLTRLWSTLSCAKAYLTFDHLSEQYLLVFLQMLRNILAQLARVSYETINLPRTSVLISQVIAALLLEDPIKLSDGLQKGICLALLEIACRFEVSLMIAEVFDEHLLPIVVEITESESRLLAIGKDLQVCMHGISSGFQFTIDRIFYTSSCGLVTSARNLKSRRIYRIHHLRTPICSRHTIRTLMSLASQQYMKMRTDLIKGFDSVSRLSMLTVEIYK